MKAIYKLLSCSVLAFSTACTADVPFVWTEPETPANTVPEFEPDYDTAIHEYDGTLANDADNDVVGNDKSFYWEANNFNNVIKVTFNGTTATVESSISNLTYDIDGAYVTVDMAKTGVKNADIQVSGTSSDGSLKIYGKNKFKLTLNGVQLESHRGPAINDQCKKRVFVHLTPGTKNTLADSQEYAAEHYYTSGYSMETEDAKGCFFSEGNMIFSGSGSLEVAARHNHGIAADGYVWVRPGVTIAVTEAAKNAIHAKGSANENIGVVINGGYIYANVAGNAGKCIKTGNNIVVNGGILALNSSASAGYDEEDGDLASSACLKSDLNTVIHGGAIILKCTGDGARNINADGFVQMTDGSVICTNTGGEYSYNGLVSASRAINADGYVAVQGGELYSYSNGRGLHADNYIHLTGGKVYTYSVDEYSIYSPFVGVANCTVLSVSANDQLNRPADQTSVVDSGYLISVGNTSFVIPDEASKQAYVLADNVSMTNGDRISLALGTDCLLNYAISIPAEVTTSILFSSPEIVSGTQYSVLYGGTVSGDTDAWYELSLGGTHTDANELLTPTAR